MHGKQLSQKHVYTPASLNYTSWLFLKAGKKDKIKICSVTRTLTMMSSVCSQRRQEIPKLKVFPRMPHNNSPRMSALDVVDPAEKAKMFCQTSCIRV